MKRWHGAIGAALIFVGVQLPHAQAGDIYKCNVAGSTVYRDQPCAPGSPDAGRLSKAESPPVIVNGHSAVALTRGIRALENRERQQHVQYNREVDRLRVRMSGVRDMQVLKREDLQLERKWQSRFAETRRQRKALIDRLKKLCPHGASVSASASICHR